MKRKVAVALLIVASIVLTTNLLEASKNRQDDQTLPDLIMIDQMREFGELERPAVPFSHDKHTRALEQRGEDCSTCHIKYTGPYVFLFDRLENGDRDTTLNIYHDGCIGCHEREVSENRASGPLECAECHPRKTDVLFSGHVPEFDKSLHQRHINATSEDCATCHHGYGRGTKVLMEVEGEETSCRDCHLGEDSAETRSYRYVAHRLCVSCHLTPSTQNIASTYQPPAVLCGECHDQTRLDKIKKLDVVPRLKRGQPDMTFVKTFNDADQGMVDAVVFDHERHENATADCRTCHHQTMDGCDTCHTITGAAAGDWIPLERATHDQNSERSCVGCHDRQKDNAVCAGCHGLIHNVEANGNQGDCQNCHTAPIEDIQKMVTSGLTPLASDYKHEGRVLSLDMDSVPAEVEINVISEQYGPVDFPHGAIINSLMDRMEGNVLANAFHQGETSVCTACHHNSQTLTDTPPRCVSCHPRTVNSSDMAVPTLNTAYHQQCFECHDVMNIAAPVSTDCEACHLKK